ncbi:MAG: MMPL family transporter, partial [Methylocystis sp.]|uniref:MMPL family transporter n=1 Tax=Methylocystis sp. TaxID=1911079 RepID=UPI003D103484
GAIMFVALRNVSLGVMSVVGNVTPIVSAFGVWALLVGEVGFSVAAVASVAIGIVVDDTVHFFTKFQRGRREKGLSSAESVRYAFETVGFAILLNTVILAIGFSILVFSSFKINAELGLLTAVTIVLALLFDFFLLPALLILTGGDRRQTQLQGAAHAKALA